MMALTIGTLPPLHKSPLQQLISHFFTFAVTDLQKSAVSVSHWDDVPQPLPYTTTETSPFVPSFMPLTQRSRFSSQVVSFLTLSQSSQLFVERHSKHFRPHPTGMETRKANTRAVFILEGSITPLDSACKMLWCSLTMD